MAAFSKNQTGETVLEKLKMLSKQIDACIFSAKINEISISEIFIDFLRIQLKRPERCLENS